MTFKLLLWFTNTGQIYVHTIWEKVAGKINKSLFLSGTLGLGGTQHKNIVLYFRKFVNSEL